MGTQQIPTSLKKNGFTSRWKLDQSHDLTPLNLMMDSTFSPCARVRPWSDTLGRVLIHARLFWVRGAAETVGRGPALFCSDERWVTAAVCRGMNEKHTDGSQPKVTATLWLIDKAHSSVKPWTPLGVQCSNQTCEIPADGLRFTYGRNISSVSRGAAGRLRFSFLSAFQMRR